MSTMKTVFLSALVMAMSLFVGCGNSTNKPASVSKAVDTYFAAFGSGEWKQIYEVMNKEQQEKMAGSSEDEKKALAKMQRMVFKDAKVIKCEDITINGDNASAQVTFSIGDKEQTKEFTLAKEEGVWKIQG